MPLKNSKKDTIWNPKRQSFAVFCVFWVEMISEILCCFFESCCFWCYETWCVITSIGGRVPSKHLNQKAFMSIPFNYSDFVRRLKVRKKGELYTYWVHCTFGITTTISASKFCRMTPTTVKLRVLTCLIKKHMQAFSDCLWRVFSILLYWDVLKKKRFSN